MARTSIAEATEHQLWDTDLFEQIKLIAAINDNDPERVRAWLHQFDSIVNFGFLGEANTYAYRHPKVSMASVLDHRFGQMRDQVHAWQAAIDEDAMVFTTHPLTAPKVTDDWNDDDSAGYWTGEASMPRSAQHRRTAVHIYQPAWSEATDALLWSVFPYRPFTHAFFPQDRFDEVRQVGNWTIASKAGGHIALWSWRTPRFRENDPGVPARTFTAPYDLVAEGGPDNVWIAEVGNDDDDGDLEAFVAAITANDPVVDRTTAGFDVTWESPASGIIRFSSTGPFVVAGAEQPIGGHPRHEGPWGTIEHESMVHQLTNGTNNWAVDFDTATRVVS
jgi:3-phenylpropionate/cinnamic acid dioxygenase small subunit